MNKKLKKGIDHIGVGVGAIILNKQGKFLLIKRGSKSQNEVGLWGFPGGAMDFGETISDTIKREVKEELGIKIKPLKLLPPVNHIIPDEKQHWVAAPYICQLISGVPKIKEPDKISEIKWFLLKDAKKLKLSIVAKQVLNELEGKYSELEDFS